jgi:predicted DNA-binding transcriptional regulator AlpA
MTKSGPEKALEGTLDDGWKRFLSVKEIAQVVGMSEASIWRWSLREDFPQSFKLSKRCRRWDKNAILEYFNSKGQKAGKRV